MPDFTVFSKCKPKNTNMLQNKDIAKIQEVKAIFKDSWVQPEFFHDHLKLFKFSKSSKLFVSAKKSVIAFWGLMRIMIMLPFMDIKTVGSFFNDATIAKPQGQKDAYYRSLANQKMNWRNLLLLFVKRYLELDKKLTSPKDSFKCLIFDDTDLQKRGKKIEGVSKIHNHVTKQFIFGYKLLVAGYWNGSVFYPK